jgi:RNA polymerase sigma-70 factor, ECF subfamily
MSVDQAADDKQLLQEAKCGNAEAFGVLYERYAPVVYRFLYANLEHRLDAEDLTEDVFLKVWRALGRYREQGVPFSAFLIRIARHTLIDYYRCGAKPEKEIELKGSLLRDTRSDPMEAVTTSFEHQQLRHMLGRLRDDYQTVLIARFISGLSPEETAAAMGKTHGAVRVLQHRALAALRKMIEKDTAQEVTKRILVKT